MIKNRYTYNSFNYQYTYIKSKAYISLLQIHTKAFFFSFMFQIYNHNYGTQIKVPCQKYNQIDSCWN